MKTDGGGWTDQITFFIKTRTLKNDKTMVLFGTNLFDLTFLQHFKIIQRRFNGKTDFYRTWEEYKHGFGKRSEEYWLGNDRIHFLTKLNSYKLRVDMEDFKGVHKFASYSSFSVGSESSGYVLNVGGYKGTAVSLSDHFTTGHIDQCIT
ncbi:hypothetical protein KUTeg_010892 [Tegillarca granosa]|uniref:Fibrinogen C-terminal domain-containing protein n=1 Tax=Tegillarca granosa TaxID=220873 RepID=A0ABQ9F5H8_TEGGR|nr:hypothetical protein KUTeg_010892 [Tegillarca granosa]